MNDPVKRPAVHTHAGRTHAGGTHAGSTHAGNLYHLRPPGPTLRREPVHRLDSTGQPPVEDAPETNPAVLARRRSIRRFAIYSLAMMALFYVSAKLIFRAWRVSDARVAARNWARITSGPAPSAPVPRPAAGQASQTPATPSPEAEAVRKSMFLAKRARALEEAGDFQQAIARYQESIAVWPDQSGVWSQLGRLYLKVRDYPRALSTLQRAVENAPASADILNDFGVACLNSDQPDRAAKLFGDAIEADPEFAPAYFNMALCRLALKDRAGAREFLGRYIEKAPGDPRALREAAALDASAQDFAAAMGYLERALVEAPDWPLLYFDAAATAALMGQTNAAFHYLDQAEPLSSAAEVYRLFISPAFKPLRDSARGREYEKDLLARAREALAAPRTTAATPPRPAEPLSSANAGPR
jgi:tetratricopeptide (TPR) repeat protein